MSTTTVGNVGAHVREVTDDEVRAFHEQGWVRLPGLMSSELAGGLLVRLKRATGLDYDELPEDHPDAQEVARRIREDGIFKIFSLPRLQDEAVWNIVASRALGEASARLSGVRPMRLVTDQVIIKLPEWTSGQDLIKGPGNLVYTSQTPWHQDFCSLPWDRAGGIQFWLALTEITPEMGAIQYLTGSHREPPLGAVQYPSERQSLEIAHPELWEKYEVSPQHHFQAGDVIAHDSLVVHYAEPNRTNRLRWVYTSYRIPADTLYNGQPFPRFVQFGIDLEQWEPFDHPKCPIVAD